MTADIRISKGLQVSATQVGTSSLAGQILLRRRNLSKIYSRWVQGAFVGQSRSWKSAFLCVGSPTLLRRNVKVPISLMLQYTGVAVFKNQALEQRQKGTSEKASAKVFPTLTRSRQKQTYLAAGTQPFPLRYSIVQQIPVFYAVPTIPTQRVMEVAAVPRIAQQIAIAHRPAVAKVRLDVANIRRAQQERINAAPTVSATKTASPIRTSATAHPNPSPNLSGYPQFSETATLNTSLDPLIEVERLADAVWSRLRRRLNREAERMGRR